MRLTPEDREFVIQQLTAALVSSYRKNTNGKEMAARSLRRLGRPTKERNADVYDTPTVRRKKAPDQPRPA